MTSFLVVAEDHDRLAERADTLERERDEARQRLTEGLAHNEARAEADRLREALRELEPYAERAEMRWMSVEDATIEIPARLVAELARRAALAGLQTKEQT